MNYEIIYGKCNSSAQSLSQEALAFLQKDSKAIIVLFGPNDSNDAFLKEYMNLEISELKESELNLLNFSRNIACSFKIAEILQDKKTCIINLFLTNEEIEKIASGNYCFDLDIFKGKASLNDLFIVCVFEKKEFTGGFVKVEESNPISGALIADEVSEFKVFLGANVADLCLAIFSSLAKNKISLDMINICYDELYFICDNKNADSVSSVLIELGCDFERQDFLFKLSFTGLGMKGVPGIMNSIYSAFENDSILILRTTDSHTTISCLLEQKNKEKSIELLKSKFALTDENIVA